MIIDLPEHRTTEFWVRTKSDEEAVRQGCYFDLDAAIRVREFTKRFIVGTTGQWKGEPFELLPWQWFDFIAPLFGWKRPNGFRRFRRFGVLIPKKNGKSTLSAVLCLYMMIADREPAAEVYLCASSKDQAKIVYKEAKKFIDESPRLQRVIRVREYASKFESKRDKGHSHLQVLAYENRGKHGFIPHFTLFDEFHEQPNWELWTTFRYAGDSRRQSLLGWISTKGFNVDRPWTEELVYARKVLSGEVIDLNYLPLLYEATDEDDPTDERTWSRVNPSMGHTIQLDVMQADYQEAKTKGGIALREFYILKVNKTISGGQGYIPREEWDACRCPGTTVKTGDCYAGLDLASTRDLNALALVSWEGTRLKHEVQFFCPEEVAGKEHSNKALYDKWTASGHLHRSPGSFIDWDRLAEIIIPILERAQPKKVLVDPHNASRLVTLLKDKGFDVVNFGQTPVNYNEAMRELDRLVATRSIDQGDNPVMSWCVGNTSVRTSKEGYVMPDKGSDRLKKIDGVPATLMGLAEAIKHPPEQESEFTTW